MDNLNNNDLVQLLTFYKQKLSDTELELLKLQLKVNELNTIILSKTEQSKNLNKNGIFINYRLDISGFLVYN